MLDNEMIFIRCLILAHFKMVRAFLTSLHRVWNQWNRYRSTYETNKKKVSCIVMHQTHDRVYCVPHVQNVGRKYDIDDHLSSHVTASQLHFHKCGERGKISHGWDMLDWKYSDLISFWIPISHCLCVEKGLCKKCKSCNWYTRWENRMLLNSQNVMM